LAKAAPIPGRHLQFAAALPLTSDIRGQEDNASRQPARRILTCIALDGEKLRRRVKLEHRPHVKNIVLSSPPPMRLTA
jgi:hypothetical protein